MARTLSDAALSSSYLGLNHDWEDFKNQGSSQPVRSMRSGLENMKTAYYDTKGALQRTVGASDWAAQNEQQADLHRARAGGMRGDLPTLETAQGLGDYGTIATDWIFSNAPLMATMFATGPIGRAVSLGTNSARAAAANAARTAATSAETTAAANVARQSVLRNAAIEEGRAGAALGAREANAAAELVRTQAGAKASAEVLSKIGDKGMLAGAFAPYAMQTIGENYGRVRTDPEAEGSDWAKAATSLAAGAGQAGIGVLAPYHLLRNLHKGMNPAGALALGGLEEGVTETAEQVLQRAHHGIYNDKVDLFDENARAEYLESFLAGAVVGGAYAAPVSAYQVYRNMQQSRKKQESDAQQDTFDLEAELNNLSNLSNESTLDDKVDPIWFDDDYKPSAGRNKEVDQTLTEAISEGTSSPENHPVANTWKEEVLARARGFAVGEEYSSADSRTHVPLEYVNPQSGQKEVLLMPKDLINDDFLFLSPNADNDADPLTGETRSNFAPIASGELREFILSNLDDFASPDKINHLFDIAYQGQLYGRAQDPSNLETETVFTANPWPEKKAIIDGNEIITQYGDINLEDFDTYTSDVASRIHDNLSNTAMIGEIDKRTGYSKDIAKTFDVVHNALSPRLVQRTPLRIKPHPLKEYYGLETAHVDSDQSVLKNPSDREQLWRAGTAWLLDHYRRNGKQLAAFGKSKLLFGTKEQVKRFWDDQHIRYWEHPQTGELIPEEATDLLRFVAMDRGGIYQGHTPNKDSEGNPLPRFENDAADGTFAILPPNYSGYIPMSGAEQGSALAMVPDGREGYTPVMNKGKMMRLGLELDHFEQGTLKETPGINNDYFLNEDKIEQARQADRHHWFGMKTSPFDSRSPNWSLNTILSSAKHPDKVMKIFNDALESGSIFDHLNKRQQKLVEAGLPPAFFTNEKNLLKLTKGIKAAGARQYIFASQSVPHSSNYSETFEQDYTNRVAELLRRKDSGQPLYSHKLNAKDRDQARKDLINANVLLPNNEGGVVANPESGFDSIEQALTTQMSRNHFNNLRDRLFRGKTPPTAFLMPETVKKLEERTGKKLIPGVSILTMNREPPLPDGSATFSYIYGGEGRFQTEGMSPERKARLRQEGFIVNPAETEFLNPQGTDFDGDEVVVTNPDEDFELSNYEELQVNGGPANKAYALSKVPLHEQVLFGEEELPNREQYEKLLRPIDAALWKYWDGMHDEIGTFIPLSFKLLQTGHLTLELAGEAVAASQGVISAQKKGANKTLIKAARDRLRKALKAVRLSRLKPSTSPEQSQLLEALEAAILRYAPQDESLALAVGASLQDQTLEALFSALQQTYEEYRSLFSESGNSLENPAVNEARERYESASYDFNLLLSEFKRVYIKSRTAADRGNGYEYSEARRMAEESYEQLTSPLVEETPFLYEIIDQALRAEKKIKSFMNEEGAWDHRMASSKGLNYVQELKERVLETMRLAELQMETPMTQTEYEMARRVVLVGNLMIEGGFGTGEIEKLIPAYITNNAEKVLTARRKDLVAAGDTAAVKRMDAVKKNLLEYRKAYDKYKADLIKLRDTSGSEEDEFGDSTVFDNSKQATLHRKIADAMRLAYQLGEYTAEELLAYAPHDLVADFIEPKDVANLNANEYGHPVQNVRFLHSNVKNRGIHAKYEQPTNWAVDAEGNKIDEQVGFPPDGIYELIDPPATRKQALDKKALVFKTTLADGSERYFRLRPTDTSTSVFLNSVYGLGRSKTKPEGKFRIKKYGNVKNEFTFERIEDELKTSPEEMETSPEETKSEEPSATEPKWAHARYSKNGYEVSTHGDKRFSALNAKLKDGRTIEEAYQLDVKGYRATSNNWRDGKGKPPLREITPEQLYEEYKALWKQFLDENPKLEQDLRVKAQGKVLTDKFASTPISQARALAELLNERALPEGATEPKSEKPTLPQTRTPEIWKKDQNKSDQATHFIGRGVPKSSTEAYYEAWKNHSPDKTNSLNYTANDVVFISSNGAVDGTITAEQKAEIAAALKAAMEAGVTFITDTKKWRERRRQDGSQYNVGEIKVAAYLEKAGYEELNASGRWVRKAAADFIDKIENQTTQTKEEAGEPTEEAPHSVETEEEGFSLKDVKVDYLTLLKGIKDSPVYFRTASTRALAGYNAGDYFMLKGIKDGPVFVVISVNPLSSTPGDSQLVFKKVAESIADFKAKIENQTTQTPEAAKKSSAEILENLKKKRREKAKKEVPASKETKDAAFDLSVGDLTEDLTQAVAKEKAEEEAPHSVETEDEGFSLSDYFTPLTIKFDYLMIKGIKDSPVYVRTTTTRSTAGYKVGDYFTFKGIEDSPVLVVTSIHPLSSTPGSSQLVFKEVAKSIENFLNIIENEEESAEEAAEEAPAPKETKDAAFDLSVGDLTEDLTQAVAKEKTEAAKKSSAEILENLKQKRREKAAEEAPAPKETKDAAFDLSVGDLTEDLTQAVAKEKTEAAKKSSAEILENLKQKRREKAEEEAPAPKETKDAAFDLSVGDLTEDLTQAVAKEKTEAAKTEEAQAQNEALPPEPEVVPKEARKESSELAAKIRKAEQAVLPKIKQVAYTLTHKLGLAPINVLTHDQAVNLLQHRNDLDLQLLGGMKGFFDPSTNSLYIRGDLTGPQLAAVLGHELGHAVLRHYFPSEASRNTPEFRQIIKDYLKFVEENGGKFGTKKDQFGLSLVESVADDKTVSSIRKARTAKHLHDLIREGKKKASELSAKDLEELFSFSEWFADQVSRWVDSQLVPKKGTSNSIFKEIADALQTLYKTVKQVIGFDPAPSVRDFIETILMRQHISEHGAAPNFDHLTNNDELRARAESLVRKVMKDRTPPTKEELKAWYDASKVMGAYNLDDAGNLLPFLQTMLTPEQFQTLKIAATGDFMRVRLQRLVRNDLSAVQAITNNPDKAAAYLAAFIRAGIIEPGPQVNGVMARFFKGWDKLSAEIEGWLPEYLAQDQILKALADSTRENFHPSQIPAEPAPVHGKVATAAISRLQKFYDKAVRKLYDPVLEFMETRLEETRIPTIRKFARMLFTPIANTEGYVPSMFANVRVVMQEELNKVDHILTDLGLLKDRARMDELGKSLLIDPENASKTFDKERRWLHAYMEGLYKRGVDSGLEIEHRKNYWPWIWNMDVLAKRRGDFDTYALDKRFAKHWTELQNKVIAAMRSAGKADGAINYLRKLSWKEFAQQRLNSLVTEGVQNIEQEDIHIPGMRFMNQRDLNFLMHSKEADKETMLQFLEINLVDHLSRYTHSMVKRSEFAKMFGANGEKFEALVEQAKAEGATDAHIKIMRDSMDMATGMYGGHTKQAINRFAASDFPMPKALREFLTDKSSGVGHRNIQNATGLWVTYEIFRILPLNVFVSFIDPLGNGIRSGSFDIMVKSVYQTFRHQAPDWFGGSPAEFKAAVQEQLDNLGTIERAAVLQLIQGEVHNLHMSPTLRRMTEAFFRWNGIEWITRTARMSSTIGANKFLIKHKEGALKDPMGNSKRYLNELNLLPEDIVVNAETGLVKTLNPKQRRKLLEDGKIEEVMRDDKIRYAMHQYVNGSTIRPGVNNRSQIFNDPNLAALGFIRNFQLMFHHTFLRRVGSELLDHGNPMPLLMLLGPFIAMMLFADWLRDLIKYGPDGAPYKQDWGAFQHIMHSADRVGIYGKDMLMWDALMPALPIIGDGDVPQGLAEAFGVGGTHLKQILSYGISERELPGYGLWGAWNN